MDELVAEAEALIRSTCHDKDGWEYQGSEPINDDTWGAETIATFRRNDYLTCYVGMVGGRAVYILQRIE